mmetsp:Transcript_4522/g.12620  ORF Transcript_4522/g.12620 Transcript_4522/m.12620 type:complete len:419 (-) Transcript_4522:128-1384(-)|eukprot:CAMPEP_0117670150 /NCGR_PEP_ID=MMETSP0804-20121206/12574_1 /TAXON_ID=1074897 /ORGANISM="Tetraselmis astigmatica, Strain CCMP880" /LENGTH=418 /DNA_ID=CAMNT_0005478379 /DNA_START=766 /DNA_END=2022 /DNA_ORIENTATION=+
MPNLMDLGSTEEVSGSSQLGSASALPPPASLPLNCGHKPPGRDMSSPERASLPEDATLITSAAFQPRKRKATLLQSPRSKSTATEDVEENDENLLVSLQENIPASMWGSFPSTDLPESKTKAAVGLGDSLCLASSASLLREDSDSSIHSEDTSVGADECAEARVPLGCLSSSDEAFEQLESVEANCEGLENDTDEEELGYPIFDPYLFMKHLPPLKDVVPAGRPPALPRKPDNCSKMTLVLDLDETLVHSSLEGPATSNFMFEVDYNSQTHQVNVYTRPFLFEFLAAVATRFEVVIFTASQRVYAEQLLNILDPECQLVQHRLYRDDCVLVDGNYVKDLTVLGRDLKRTVIVDNSPHAFGYNIENGIPIESWYDDQQDQELQHLLAFLDDLAKMDDVRPAISSTFQTHELIQVAGLEA